MFTVVTMFDMVNIGYYMLQVSTVDLSVFGIILP